MNIENTYSHRRSALTRIRRYEALERALSWQDENGPRHKLDYNDIISVSGKYTPSRIQANRYLLRLETRTKGNIDITNTSYKSFANFVEHNDTYIPFTKALHKRIAASNPNVTFKQGISKAGYYLSILTAILLIIVVLVAGYFFLLFGLIAVVVIKTALIIFYFPRFIRYIKKNKPGFYDPIHLPSEIIPNN